MMIGKPTENIIDRKDEVEKIVNAMIKPKTNVNYALIGHRRIGKSTIILEAKRKLEKHKIIVAYIDFGQYSYSPVDFAEALTERLTDAYAKTLPRSSKILSKISASLIQLKEIKRLRARFITSIDGEGKPVIEIDPFIKDRNENYAKALTNAFEYANKLSKVSKKRVVIMIDEFQHVIDYKRFKELQKILDIFKTILEQRANVSFVVSGSKIHYMKNILAEGQSPLFGHFVIIDVKPLEKKYAIELYETLSHKRTTSDANEAYELVGGHPYYLTMLAEAKGKETVKDTYVRLLTLPTGALYLYVNYVLTEDLGSNYKDTNYPKILLALAGGEKTISQISKETSVRLTDLPKLLTTLIEYDIVNKVEGKYSITDKIVRDFFYFNYLK
ncbi:MAG: ATP-binding protein [Candidatus Nitrosotenuis sp.]